MTTLELGGVKTGGLSLTSDMSMLRVTVEDMAGEPLSNACTDRVYLDTWSRRGGGRGGEECHNICIHQTM